MAGQLIALLQCYHGVVSVSATISRADFWWRGALDPLDSNLLGRPRTVIRRGLQETVSDSCHTLAYNGVQRR